MARPCIRGAKHRREYIILCEDPHFHMRKYFVRDGYKSLLLREFVSRYPDYNISIYVLSGRVVSNIK